MGNVRRARSSAEVPSATGSGRRDRRQSRTSGRAHGEIARPLGSYLRPRWYGLSAHRGNRERGSELRGGGRKLRRRGGTLRAGGRRALSGDIGHLVARLRGRPALGHRGLLDDLLGDRRPVVRAWRERSGPRRNPDRSGGTRRRRGSALQGCRRSVTSHGGRGTRGLGLRSRFHGGGQARHDPWTARLDHGRPQLRDSIRGCLAACVERLRRVRRRRRRAGAPGNASPGSRRCGLGGDRGRRHRVPARTTRRPGRTGALWASTGAPPRWCFRRRGPPTPPRTRPSWASGLNHSFLHKLSLPKCRDESAVRPSPPRPRGAAGAPGAREHRGHRVHHVFCRFLAATPIARRSRSP